MSTWYVAACDDRARWTGTGRATLVEALADIHYDSEAGRHAIRVVATSYDTEKRGPFVQHGVASADELLKYARQLGRKLLDEGGLEDAWLKGAGEKAMTAFANYLVGDISEDEYQQVASSCCQRLSEWVRMNLECSMGNPAPRAIAEFFRLLLTPEAVNHVPELMQRAAHVIRAFGWNETGEKALCRLFGVA